MVSFLPVLQAILLECNGLAGCPHNVPGERGVEASVKKLARNKKGKTLERETCEIFMLFAVKAMKYGKFLL